MSPLTPERARELFQLVEAEALSHGVQDIELSVGETSEALTRFANNAIHQNVAETNLGISVRPQENGRTARADTNRLDADTVLRTVRDSIALMRSQEPDDRLLALAEPAPLVKLARLAESTVSCTPSQRAAAVAEAIRIAEGQGQTAAGIYSTGHSREALCNSRGVFGWHEQSMAVFSVTMMEAGSSGWAKASEVDRAGLDVAALAGRASDKARHSRNPRELEPGRYTVILEPAAVLDLVGQIFGDFGGT